MIKNIEKIDAINVFLILFSAAAAFLLPFKLFIFSYAILGPLHYFTQISWLNKKDFFLAKKEKNLLLITAIFASIILLNLELIMQFGENLFFYDKNFISSFVSILSTIVIFLTFALAFILVIVKDRFTQIISGFAAVFLSIFLFNFNSYIYFFGVFLTTIIHVWFFTAIFMLSGAIKAKKFSSYFAFVIFILTSLSFVLIDFSTIEASNKVKEIINISAINLNKNLSDFLNFNIAENDFFSNQTAIKIQSFIAFAYSYHYLNWFSKVELIKWHQVEKSNLLACFILWVLSISLYFYDFKIGLLALFFFSLIHVLLEFPLNFRSFATISKK